jgi:rusticyanin
MKSIGVFAVGAALLVAPGLIGAACAQTGYGSPYGSMMSGSWGMGPGMMGRGMMGSMMNDRPVSRDWGGGVANYSQAKSYIQYGNAHGAADSKTNTVSFTGKAVTIDLVAVESGFKDQTFELHGLANPTVVVPRGAAVRLNLLNMDCGRNMEHTLLLTDAAPPYPYMAMMSAGASIMPAMPELPWRNGAKAEKSEYAISAISFIATEPGTYWYICPTPEHAEKGMYGKFIIR